MPRYQTMTYPNAEESAEVAGNFPNGWIETRGGYPWAVHIMFKISCALAGLTVEYDNWSPSKSTKLDEDALRSWK
jgi:hypothetical protein